MAVSYTTADLLARIRRTAQLADVNLKLSDSEIIEIADEAIQSRLWPELRTSVDEYLTKHAYVTFQAPSTEYPESGVARLPPRASGSTIVAVYQVDINGVVRPIPHIDISEAQRFGDEYIGTQRTGPHPRFYALSGDFIRIVPAASVPITLRVLYERRPSRLTLPENCALAESYSVVDGQTLDVTVADIPIAFAEGDTVDIVRASQLATDSIADDAAIGTLADPVITLGLGSTFQTSYEIVAQTSGGAYICPAGTSCVFTLPDNWYPIAVLAGAADALQQCGYVDEYAALVPQVEAKIALAVKHNANRARKQPKAIFDRDSPMRTGGWGAWGRNGNWGGT